MPGMIIALEGLDGSGKTIQSVKLANTLSSLNYPVSLYKEPSGTATGHYLRNYLAVGARQNPTAEAALFLAAHAELMDQQVNPDLEAGKIIIMDRFIPSCVAYQCYIHGIPREPIMALYQHANGGPTPYFTFLLDITPEESFRRTTSEDAHSPHEYDYASIDQRARTRQGYVDQANDRPEYWQVVDGHQSIIQVAQNLLEQSLKLIVEHGYPEAPAI